MKHSKVIAFVSAAALGLAVSAMAQARGRSGGHPMGGPPAGAGPGMGGPGMGGAMGPMGQTARGPMGEMGQAGRMGTLPAPKTASDLLKGNSKLSSHLASTLGVSSSTLLRDASGFKNLGLFVAAMHVSKNLNVPFDQLSSAVRKDGNLGKAIHSLQPNLQKGQVKDAVKKAKKQAKKDIRTAKH